MYHPKMVIEGKQLYKPSDSDSDYIWTPDGLVHKARIFAPQLLNERQLKSAPKKDSPITDTAVNRSHN